MESLEESCHLMPQLRTVVLFDVLGIKPNREYWVRIVKVNDVEFQRF